jgi:hypothetical protein
MRGAKTSHRRPRCAGGTATIRLGSPEFRRRYEAELAEAHEALEELRSLANRGPLTLSTATREVSRGNAAVLADVLRKGFVGTRSM